MDIFGQGFDLLFDLFVFVQLAFEELDGDAALFLHSLRGKDVGIAALGLGLLKAFDLYKSLFGQLPNTVVDLAHTDPHVSGHVPLTEPGVLGHEVEEVVVDFLVEHRVHSLNLLEDGVGVVKGKIKIVKIIFEPRTRRTRRTRRGFFVVGSF